MIERCTRRTDVGVFAMGAMLVDDYREYSAHIVDCPSCSAELAELVPVLAVLEAAGPYTPHDDTIPETLRAKVLSAFDRQSTQALLAGVRGSHTIASIDLTNPPTNEADEANETNKTNEANEANEEFRRNERLATTAPVEKSDTGRRAGSWKLFAVAASLIALAVSAVALTSRGESDAVKTRYELVALEKDPLIATAQVSTTDDTTVAEFVVDGTVPGEIYFAWFEDPAGTRVGLGSFRGAEGRVTFRGQTGVARGDLVAIGATTRKGEARTDRMRAELPRS